MKKIYLVFHEYEVDYGEDIGTVEATIMAFNNKADADTFVKRFSNPRFYYNSQRCPNDDRQVRCGHLDIDEITLVDHIDLDHIMDTSDFWWLHPENDG